MLGSQNLESSDLPPQPTSSWTISSSEPAQGGKSGRAAWLALEIAPPIPQASKRLRISWLLAARRIIQSDLNDNNTNSRSITVTPSLCGLDSIRFVWPCCARPSASRNGPHKRLSSILAVYFGAKVLGERDWPGLRPVHHYPKTTPRLSLFDRAADAANNGGV